MKKVIQWIFVSLLIVIFGLLNIGQAYAKAQLNGDSVLGKELNRLEKIQLKLKDKNFGKEKREELFKKVKRILERPKSQDISKLQKVLSQHAN